MFFYLTILILLSPHHILSLQAKNATVESDRECSFLPSFLPEQVDERTSNCMFTCTDKQAEWWSRASLGNPWRSKRRQTQRSVMAAIASASKKGATSADAQLASPCSVLSTACPLLAVSAVFAPSDGGLNRERLAENAARGAVYVQSAPQLTWAESARQCYTNNAARESATYSYRSTTEQGGALLTQAEAGQQRCAASSGSGVRVPSSNAAIGRGRLPIRRRGKASSLASIDTLACGNESKVKEPLSDDDHLADGCLCLPPPFVTFSRSPTMAPMTSALNTSLQGCCDDDEDDNCSITPEPLSAPRNAPGAPMRDSGAGFDRYSPRLQARKHLRRPSPSADFLVEMPPRHPRASLPEWPSQPLFMSGNR